RVTLDLLARRQWRKSELGLFECRVECTRHPPNRTFEHFTAACGQLFTVSCGELECPPRYRVLIRAAARHKHRLRARISPLELDLGKSGVVSAKLVSIENRAVTGVSENCGDERSAWSVDTEDWHVVIDRTLEL